MTCLSITQWSLPNFYSLQGIIHLFLLRETWQARSVGRDSLSARAEGDETHIPHIDSAALGVREYIITVHTLLFLFN